MCVCVGVGWGGAVPGGAGGDVQNLYLPLCVCVGGGAVPGGAGGDVQNLYLPLTLTVNLKPL